MLTGLAILERELGILEYEAHRLRRRLAGRLPKAEGDVLRREFKALERRRAKTLDLLDELHEEYDERVERAVAGIRARAARTPFSRRETPDEARRRLGIPRR
jgi:hypothetical protein